MSLLHEQPRRLVPGGRQARAAKAVWGQTKAGGRRAEERQSTRGVGGGFSRRRPRTRRANGRAQGGGRRGRRRGEAAAAARGPLAAAAARARASCTRGGPPATDPRPAAQAGPGETHGGRGEGRGALRGDVAWRFARFARRDPEARVGLAGPAHGGVEIQGLGSRRAGAGGSAAWPGRRSGPALSRDWLSKPGGVRAGQAVPGPDLC